MAEEGVGRLRSHPITVAPESPHAAAAAVAAAAAASGHDAPWGGFVAVGTSIRQTGDDGEPLPWNDESNGTLQGRLILLQLCSATSAAAGAATAPRGHSPSPERRPRRRLQLRPVAELHLPSRVLALCAGSTDMTGRHSSSGGSGSRGDVAASRLFASVGRRLVSFEWRPRQQLLRRVLWAPTLRPVCSLQVRPGAWGSCCWRGVVSTVCQ